MKQLFLALIVIGTFAVWTYVDTMAPTWQVTAAQQAAIDLRIATQNAPADARAHQLRSEWFTWTLVSLTVLALAWGAVRVWAIYDERQESRSRMVDGSYALQLMSAGGQAWVIDPNKSAFGVVGVDKRSGALTTDAAMVGADRQLDYAKAIQPTRTAAAVGGDNGIRNSAQAKLAAGYYDRPQRQPDYRVVEDAPAPAQLTEFKALTCADAFAQSTRFNWLLGQNQETGETFALNPKESAHFGVVGATGSGKTAYLAMLLMANAIKNKFRVSVLDGKGGADWSKYKDLVEYNALDYSNIGDYVDTLANEYHKRQAILNLHQVNSIWELPQGVTKPRPTMIVIDEFGAVMDGLKAASKNAYKHVELELSNLLRLSRGAGLYVVLCDQNPSKWPGTVRANMPLNICFRLGGSIGNAVNEYNLDRLDRVGHFQVSGKSYHAWPAYEVIDGILADVPYTKPRALLATPKPVTGYGKQGGAIDPNPHHPPAPVTDDYSTGYTRVTAPVTEVTETVTAPVTTVLAGAPVTAQDREQVRNIYALTGSKSETCRVVWGGKNGQRMAWLNEVLADHAGRVMQ